MGGLGKTTLAQLVYDDNRVEEHFGLKAWVCISNDFDVLKITKTISERVGLSTHGDSKDLDLLQVALKQKLMEKKFLIVLDDIWNENYDAWEILCKPFRNGPQGSRIIATTRGLHVASVMRSTITYPLKKLPEEDCWSLFAKHAFRDNDLGVHPELEAIGREIVKKCNGLPLAAKAIGSLLWSKLDINEWDKILKSELWDLQTDVIPALRLSYQYLPSHLKQCFAYCSIFPQDYKFRKEELILLWMAEGFFQQDKQVGDEYFRHLVARSCSNNQVTMRIFL
ncbi:putative disease resistance RPP13-like protein 1 [Morella rubra]|uniref:Putative disease resistance RPP13-like protein 1 n=1 Tax=Morella rubra TaxID=262757 RepID=A0A6A1VGS6_9ROSI|nr:putative disease resistance RPP13-like protein 1 [Morella rubra]